jgi:hypothetical protein
MRARTLKHFALLTLLAASGNASFGATGIWDLMRAMRATQVDERSVQALFGARIEQRYGNGYWTFAEGKGPTLGDGVGIARFGFMTKNDGAAPPTIYMHLDGRCIAYDDVRTAYPDLQSDGTAPTVHAPRMVYWSRRGDGDMQFSFTATPGAAPRCLVDVGFSPKT